MNHPTRDLLEIFGEAKIFGQPTVNLTSIGVPVTVSTNLHEVLITHEEPEVCLEWDAKSLTVKKTDGGILAVLEIAF